MALESNETVVLGISGVTFHDVVAVARNNAKVVISPVAIDAISKAMQQGEFLCTAFLLDSAPLRIVILM
jgi:hypothetical protein